jgi:hypothetical protein
MCNLDNMFIDLLNSPWVHDCFDEDMFETYDHKYYMREYLLSSYYLPPIYLISPLAYKSAMIYFSTTRETAKFYFVFITHPAAKSMVIHDNNSDRHLDTDNQQ